MGGWLGWFVVYWAACFYIIIHFQLENMVRDRVRPMVYIITFFSAPFLPILFLGKMLSLNNDPD